MLQPCFLFCKSICKETTVTQTDITKKQCVIGVNTGGGMNHHLNSFVFERYQTWKSPHGKKTESFLLVFAKYLRFLKKKKDFLQKMSSRQNIKLHLRDVHVNDFRGLLKQKPTILKKTL